MTAREDEKVEQRLPGYSVDVENGLVMMKTSEFGARLEEDDGFSFETGVEEVRDGEVSIQIGADRGEDRIGALVMIPAEKAADIAETLEYAAEIARQQEVAHDGH